jgi:hypothetical protein
VTPSSRQLYRARDGLLSVGLRFISTRKLRLFGSLIFALSASAAPVTFFFTGQVNSEAINGCGVLVNCGVVFGSYTFDSAAPDQNADPTAGLYAATNITFSIDGVSFFSASTGVINVANFAQVDQYGILASGTATNGSTALLSILLSDNTATAFSSDASPQTPGALLPLLPGTFQLNAADDTFQLLGSITNINALPAGSGLIRICKVGVAGVALGANFSFTAGGAALTVPAGPTPTGTCSAPITEPAGTIALSETLPAGIALTAITATPAANLLVSDVNSATATATVMEASLTTVTFTDALLINTGLVQVCKSAGSGVSIGSPFQFNVAGTVVTVAAGSCGRSVLEPSGPVVITETLPSSIALSAVATTPPAALVSANLAAGTATVTVAAGGQTTATFTDSLAAGALIAAGPFQVRYAANLNIGDSHVDITNVGSVTGALLDGADPSGNICVNTYTFDPAEELVSCCACLVTPNGLSSLSVRNDLLAATLTPAQPTSVVIKLLASTPVGGTCNAAAPSATNLVLGMRAWGSTLHALPTSPVTYGNTETPFSQAELSLPELSHITTFCQFIQSNGSGFGVCKSCTAGGR